MIIGLGTDIVSISRVQKACEQHKFKAKCFTECEIEYCESKGKMAGASFAGFFAAKEAAVKALGTGFSGLKPIEVEIAKDFMGKPCLRLHGNAEALAEQMGVSGSYTSISHCDEYAVATVVIESSHTDGGNRGN